MQRFSISVDDELASWIEAEAEERGVSKAKVIRDAIAVARESETELVQTGDVLARLADLESRVEELERTREEAIGDELAAAVAEHRGIDLPGEDDAGSDGVQTPAPPSSESTDDPLDEQVQTYLDDHPPQSDEGEAAILTAWRRLRDVELAQTAELRAYVYERHAGAYADENALWQSIQRYFDDIPGIEKSGRGEWKYAGDDVARTELTE